MVALLSLFARRHPILARLLLAPLRPRLRDLSVRSDLSDHLKRDIGILDGNVTMHAAL